MEEEVDIWPKGEPRPQLHGNVWTVDGKIWLVTAAYFDGNANVYAWDLQHKNEVKEEVTKEKMAEAVKNKKAKCLGLNRDIWNSLQ